MQTVMLASPNWSSRWRHLRQCCIAAQVTPFVRETCDRTFMSDEDEARRHHRAIWEMREGQPDGNPIPWWRISERLGVPVSRLRAIRLAAQRIGLAEKDPPTGRVKWHPTDE